MTKGKAILAALAIASLVPAAWYAWSRWSSSPGAYRTGVSEPAQSLPPPAAVGQAPEKETEAATVTGPEPSSPEPASTGQASPERPAPERRLRHRNAADGASATGRPRDENSAAGAGRADMAAELRLIRQARGKLAHSASQALLLAEQHRALYPDGMFAQEREAIAIEALVKIGETKRARERAAVFESLYPSSVYIRHIRLLLGGS